MAKKKKSAAQRPSRKPSATKGKAVKKTSRRAAKGAKKVTAKSKKAAAKPVKRKASTSKAARPKPVARKKVAAVKKAAKPIVKPKAQAKPAKKPIAKAPAPPAQAKPAITPKPAPAKVAGPSVAKPVVAAKPAQAPEVAVASKPVEVPNPVEKKPLKERMTMEFQVNSAPNVLYELLSTPSGFSEWYCDDVNVRGDQYTFVWNGEEEPTTMIGRKLGEVIRFHRNDDEDEAAFFEFRIRIDAMTNEVALIVTDHAWPQEVEDTRNLWTSQIANLVRVLGA